LVCCSSNWNEYIIIGKQYIIHIFSSFNCERRNNCEKRAFKIGCRLDISRCSNCCTFLVLIIMDLKNKKGGGGLSVIFISTIHYLLFHILDGNDEYNFWSLSVIGMLISFPSLLIFSSQ